MSNSDPVVNLTPSSVPGISVDGSGNLDLATQNTTSTVNLAPGGTTQAQVVYTAGANAYVTLTGGVNGPPVIGVNGDYQLYLQGGNYNAVVAATDFQCNANFLQSVATGITAAGTTQGTATGLASSGFSVVSTVASGTGVLLGASSAGAITTVFNQGANTLNVYPPTNCTINTQSVNTAITIAAAGALTFYFATVTQIYTH